MTTEHTDIEEAADLLCGSCTARKGCEIEGAARVYWPEHERFPVEWHATDRGWRCSAYQAPRLVGTGRIDDPAQVEMFSA